MIKCVSRKFYDMVGQKTLYVKRLVMDTEADFDSLPEAAPGSYAVVADGSKKYMVNASGEWVEHSSSVEQIRNVVNEVMNEALGGEY